MNETNKTKEGQTEAVFYNLNNVYLTPNEKIDVESWFQAPGNVMTYIFYVLAIWSAYNTLSWLVIIGISVLINIIVGILNWYIYNKKIIRILGLTLFHPYVVGFFGIIVGTFLFSKSHIILAIISVLVGIFGFLFLEVHIFIYSILAKKYHMHPKYTLFKDSMDTNFHLIMKP
jgi:hypothetical protein